MQVKDRAADPTCDEFSEQNDFGGFSSRAANYGHAHITNRTIWTFLNEVHVRALNGLTSEVTARIVHCSLEPPRQSERSLSCINLYNYIPENIALPPNYEIYNFLYTVTLDILFMVLHVWGFIP